MRNRTDLKNPMNQYSQYSQLKQALKPECHEVKRDRSP
jgi:hypothetical protein